MGEKHVVRFEPVGIEIEVDEEQTVLRAAAEQGITLMHGCKEGQCASCKSFVLDGDDIELDRYSTFALPDFELDEGFTLLCRAHVYEDVTIELLNYDEEMIRSGHPIQEAVAEVVSNEHVTHDMRHLVLKLVEPHGDRVLARPVRRHHHPRHRRDPVVLDGEHVVQQGERPARVRHPGLPGRPVLAASWTPKLAVGDRLDVVGPFGVFTLRDGRDSDMVFVGGGAGMAPILSVLRSLAERGQHPQGDVLLRRPDPAGPVLRGGAVRALGARCPTSATSRRCPRPTATRTWDGEVGLITDVVQKHETDLSGADSYVCGPPPMVEAAMDVLSALGRSREAHLLRQVHHHRSEPEHTTAESEAEPT